MQPGVLSGGNLVYCAPTSGGKSAVAEILMLRRLITTGRTAMLVMPFVTLCAEKSLHLERLLKPLEKWVCPSAFPSQAFCDVSVICTVTVIVLRHACIGLRHTCIELGHSCIELGHACMTCLGRNVLSVSYACLGQDLA